MGAFPLSALLPYQIAKHVAKHVPQSPRTARPLASILHRGTGDDPP
jgi:hypothetical protein